MLLVIDNYDSFTFNLVQYLGEMGVEMQVYRNDQIRLEEALALKPEQLLISPGPCSPREAGLSNDLIRAFFGDGGTALVISSDLPEVLALGDRILVMREGRQMGVIDSADATQEGIMAVATGQKVAA